MTIRLTFPPDVETKSSPLAILRTIVGMRQSDLAERLGVVEFTIHRAETGTPPKRHTKAALAEFAAQGSPDVIDELAEALASGKRLRVAAVEFEVVVDGSPGRG